MLMYVDVFFVLLLIIWNMWFLCVVALAGVTQLLQVSLDDSFPHGCSSNTFRCRIPMAPFEHLCVVSAPTQTLRLGFCMSNSILATIYPRDIQPTVTRPGHHPSQSHSLIQNHERSQTRLRTRRSTGLQFTVPRCPT